MIVMLGFIKKFFWMFKLFMNLVWGVEKVMVCWIFFVFVNVFMMFLGICNVFKWEWVVMIRFLLFLCIVSSNFFCVFINLGEYRE